MKVLIQPMNNPLAVSPSKGNQGTTRGKEKLYLTSVGIEATTSGLGRTEKAGNIKYIHIGQRGRSKERAFDERGLVVCPPIRSSPLTESLG